MTRGVILPVNVKFRRAWFILYKFILNKQNLLIMLFPFPLWSEFHFSPVGHGLSGFSMAWISFFSYRSCSFRFSHDSKVEFSLRVILPRTQGKEILHSAPFEKNCKRMSRILGYFETDFLNIEVCLLVYILNVM